MTCPYCGSGQVSRFENDEYECEDCGAVWENVR